MTEMFKFKRGVFWFGCFAWLGGGTDRLIAWFSDGWLSAIDLMQLFTWLVFFGSWLLLKPDASKNVID